MNQLQTFYRNQSQRDSVKEFMFAMLREIAVEAAFEGKSVGGIPEAKQVIDRAFDRLEEMYGKIEPSKPLSPR